MALDPVSFRLPICIVAALALAACSDDSGGGNKAGSSANNPAEVTVGEPLEGTVGAGDSFFTVFTTVEAGDYDISLTGDDLSWTLYDDEDYTALAVPRAATVADCPSGSCSTGSLDSGLELYLEIQNGGAAAEDFTLNVDDGLGEGSVNEPIMLTVTDTPSVFAASVGTGDSYYQLDLYMVSVWAFGASDSEVDNNAPLADDLDLYVYTDAAFENLDASSAAEGTAAECALTNSLADTFYLRVDGSPSEAGLSFFIHVFEE